jgi:hypothetical protein
LQYYRKRCEAKASYQRGGSGYPVYAEEKSQEMNQVTLEYRATASDE